MVRESSTGLGRGPATLDLGFGHFILTEVTPETVDDPERPPSYNPAAQSGYARLAGMSPAALTTAMKSYLPIAWVINLLCGAKGASPERLLQRIEAALHSED